MSKSLLWLSGFILFVIESKWKDEWWEWWPGLKFYCAQQWNWLELRCIWVWLSNDMGRGWGAICIGVWIVVGSHMPWNWPLSPQPQLPHICALRKSRVQRSWSCFHNVFAESRPTFGAWMTKSSRAEDRVTSPISVQSTTWFWTQHGSEILEGWRECGATLVAWKSRGTRIPDGAFDTEAQGLRVGNGAEAVEAPLK